MAKFTPAAGLNQRVAALIARRALPHLQQQVRDKARQYCPPERVWVTMRDALVRKEHREADGQAIPGNLRFILNSPDYDRRHYGCGTRQQLRQPRDEAGTPGLTYNCRCQVQVNPHTIRDKIEVERVVVAGSRVSGKVTVTYRRIVESEFGTPGDEPARFMGRAVRDVAATMR